MKKQSIILVGGGGHCVSCIDVIENTGQFEIIGILDNAEKVGTKILDYTIIGTDDNIPELAKKYSNFGITVGQIKSSKLRQTIYEKVKKAGGILPVIISTTAYVSQYAVIDEGTIVMHQAFINAEAQIGKCGIINSKALIEHEAIVGDFTHISTGSLINGQSRIGNKCFIGSNTVVSNNVIITDESIISAGSQVLNNISEPGVYIGNPLRKIRQA